MIRIAIRLLKRTDEYQKKQSDCATDPFVLECILVKENIWPPNDMLVLASSKDVGLRFRVHLAPPNTVDLSDNQPFELTLFDYDEDFFQMLESGYIILHLSPEFHCGAWAMIENCMCTGHSIQDDITYQKGLQKYLYYCKKEGITQKRLKSEFQYNGPDIMCFIKKNDVEKSKKRQNSKGHEH